MTYKSFISMVMAAAIALTALSAAPARADNDTAKIIAGAAALAMIGIAIAEANDRDDRYVTRQGYYRDPYPRPRYVRQRHHHRHYQLTRGHAHRYDGRHRHGRWCHHR